MVADLMRTGLAWFGFWALLCSAQSGLGQELADPTARPPGVDSQKESGGQRLQSIIISDDRRAAVIDGQTVELGGKAGDYRLIEISESGVVLEGTRGRQVLTLFPGVKINRKRPPQQMNEEEMNPAGQDGAAEEAAARAGK